MCTLDLSNAFDRTNHYALFIKLMQRNLLVQLLTKYELWFTVSVTCVNWKDHFSCYISATCCSIFLYDDDILLISPSVSALRILLNACEEELLAIDMYVNTKKSMYIRFGRRYTEQCAELVTADGGHISWTDRYRYSGVYFTRGCSLKCCLEEAKFRFLGRLTPFSVKRAAAQPNL